MPLNKKTVKYYLANQEVGSIEAEMDESFLGYVQHKILDISGVINLVPPPVEEIHCVSILDLISKLIDRINEMQSKIDNSNEEIKDLYRSINSD